MKMKKPFAVKQIKCFFFVTKNESLRQFVRSIQTRPQGLAAVVGARLEVVEGVEKP
jgi:hypothetical protein